MARTDLDDFVACASGERRKRKEAERFRCFALADLLARDLLPPPDEVAPEIVENLELALERLRSVAAKLQST